VAFIARGAHRDAIRRDGLKIESALGDLHLKDVNVTDDPTQVGRVDVGYLRRQANRRARC
jgi:2-dehydropantoate 2-reductase